MLIRILRILRFPFLDQLHDTWPDGPLGTGMALYYCDGRQHGSDSRSNGYAQSHLVEGDPESHAQRDTHSHKHGQTLNLAAQKQDEEGQRHQPCKSQEQPVRVAGAELVPDDLRAGHQPNQAGSDGPVVAGSIHARTLAPPPAGVYRGIRQERQKLP